MNGKRTKSKEFKVGELCLNLEGKELTLSEELRRDMDNIDIQEILVNRGPESMAIGDYSPELVYTKEAWPHTDPTFKGKRFFTIVLSKQLYSFGSQSIPDEVRLKQGYVFEVNPMELHWLRPDALAYDAWLALQWSVKEEDAPSFRELFKEKLKEWNDPSFQFPTF